MNSSTLHLCSSWGFPESPWMTSSFFAKFDSSDTIPGFMAKKAAMICTSQLPHTAFIENSPVIKVECSQVQLQQITQITRNLLGQTIFFLCNSKDIFVKFQPHNIKDDYRAVQLGCEEFIALQKGKAQLIFYF